MTSDIFKLIKRNGVTDSQMLDFIKNPEPSYLINTIQIATKFRNEGFYSDEMDARLNNIFDDLNITLGQLDLFFYNYKDNLREYLMTGKMNEEVLNLLKNNFFSSNPIARQFVKWINKWADDTKAELYYLKSENFLKWITCVDEVEFFRCLHCDNYKKKIETTLTDEGDYIFFKENKFLYKKQLEYTLNFEFEESLKVTEELAIKRRAFDKRNLIE